MVASEKQRASATAMLVHYLGIAIDPGVKWSPPQVAEVRSLVDDIVEACIVECRVQVLEDLKVLRDEALVEIAEEGGAPVPLCEQSECLNPAAHSYVWPGKDGRLLVCENHAGRVRSISQTLGMGDLDIRPLVQLPEDEAARRQVLREGRSLGIVGDTPGGE